jgi:hypothetical protein
MILSHMILSHENGKRLSIQTRKSGGVPRSHRTEHLARKVFPKNRLFAVSSILTSLPALTLDRSSRSLSLTVRQARQLTRSTGVKRMTVSIIRRYTSIGQKAVELGTSIPTLRVAVIRRGPAFSRKVFFALGNLPTRRARCIGETKPQSS